MKGLEPAIRKPDPKIVPLLKDLVDLKTIEDVPPLDIFNLRQRDLVQRKLGLVPYDYPQTDEEICKEMNITKEMFSFIWDKCRTKLKREFKRRKWEADKFKKLFESLVRASKKGYNLWAGYKRAKKTKPNLTFLQFYSKKLGSLAWKRQRDKLLQRRGVRCEDCGSRYDLQIHHLRYTRFLQEKREDYRVLCFSCHVKYHPHMNGLPSEQYLLSNQ